MGGGGLCGVFMVVMVLNSYIKYQCEVLLLVAFFYFKTKQLAHNPKEAVAHAHNHAEY